MIRTRNFLLFILLLAFLIGAILLTIWFSASSSTQGRYTDMIFSSGDIATKTAAVVVPEETRASRLDALRKKLAEYTGEVLSLDEEVATTEADASITDSPVATTTAPKVAAKICPDYAPALVPALSGQLMYVVAGGQRTFGVVETVPAVSSTTEPTVTVTTVFTLPLRTVPAPIQSCISRDIVAVSPTGAPIRNADVAAYRAAGEATLIGYTIDGFELYGQSSSLATDECGGTTVSGTYRYYLSSERDTMLNCFAAIPVAL